MRPTALIAGALCALAIAVAPADAHVYVKSRSPGKGATVSRDLGKVKVSLTGPIIKGRLRVRRKSTGEVLASGGKRGANRIVAKVSRRLPRGKCVARVRLTAADGHVQKFGWKFTAR
jgi:methionine-rich copper-binding protein CopC